MNTISKMTVSSGAWNAMAAWTAGQISGQVLYVSLPRWAEEARRLTDLGCATGHSCSLCLLEDGLSDDQIMGRIFLRTSPNIGLIAVFGAGKIVDLALKAAGLLGIASAVLLTEPDALAGGEVVPDAVFADLDALCQASDYAISSAYAALLAAAPQQAAELTASALAAKEPTALAALQTGLLTSRAQRNAAVSEEEPSYQALIDAQIRTRLDSIRCFVLDMDGTIYLEGNLFPFTKHVLQTLQAQGKDFVFFTNNSSKCQKDYIDKLNGMGIPADEQHVFISNHVIIDFLKRQHPGKTLYIVGTDSLKQEFLTHGFTLDEENPDIVILGFDTSLHYAKLKNACDFIRHGALYYGVNPDLNCPVAGLEYIPDCGSIARLIESSTGQYPEFFGKPSRRALEYIMAQTGYQEEELCFVGDRLYTDIAIACGTKASSILVLTGESTTEDIEIMGFRPDIILSSIEDLLRYLGTTAENGSRFLRKH